jgi:hypothetical protein
VCIDAVDVTAAGYLSDADVRVVLGDLALIELQRANHALLDALADRIGQVGDRGARAY